MASSPLARLRSGNPSRPLQMYQPGQSSPLSGSSSPTYSADTRRKRQYKPQGPSRSSLPTPCLLGAFEDTPQKMFLRERFKAHCLERARKGRGRTVQTRREIRYANESSSDGFDVDDDVMDEGDDGVLNDEVRDRLEWTRGWFLTNPTLTRFTAGSCLVRHADPSMQSEYHSKKNLGVP